MASTARAASGLLVALACLGSAARAEPARSDWNGCALPQTPPATYRFLALGHTYGRPGGDHARPAASLTANVAKLAARDALFCALLGDVMWTATPARLDAFVEDVAKPLGIPVFNAKGNHDRTPEYDRRFGEPNFSFRVGGDLHGFLDTSQSDRLEGPAEAFLLGLLEQAQAPAVRRLFIYSHRVVWCVDDPRYRPVYDQLNDRAGYAPPGTPPQPFATPLTALAASKQVFWISGDVGLRSLPFFVDRHPASAVTYVAVGLGDGPRDAALEVEVRADGVSVRSVPLAAGAPTTIEGGNLDRWTEFPRPKPVTPPFALPALALLVALLAVAVVRRRAAPADPGMDENPAR